MSKTITYKNKLFEDGTVIRSFGGRRKNKTSFDVDQARLSGKKQKTFKITPSIKRAIRCSALRQYLTAKHKILFCTLTFPEKIEEKKANECFSKFVENLTENYGLKSYVAVRENQNKAGGYHLHYHCLFDLPYTNFKKLNKAWIATFRGLIRGSANAFTTGRNKFALDVRQVSAYISKYLAKCDYNKQSNIEKLKLPESRIFFCSENVLSAPAMVTDAYLALLLATKIHTIYESDYFTVYIFHDFSCLPENELQKIKDSHARLEKLKRKKPPKIQKTTDALQPNFCF